MQTVAHPKNIDVIKTTKVTTTLFDLIAGMQENTADTTDDTAIVQTVTELMRSGRIQFHKEMTEQTAA